VEVVLFLIPWETEKKVRSGGWALFGVDEVPDSEFRLPGGRKRGVELGSLFLSPEEKKGREKGREKKLSICGMSKRGPGGAQLETRGGADVDA